MASSEAQTSEPGLVPQRSLQLGAVFSITGGHLLHDTFSAFLTPLLPLLIAKLSLSLTIAGSLTLFAGLPSLLQPFIGYIAERVNLRYFVILAPAGTVAIMSLLGLAPNLGILILMVVAYGTCSAMFHAPAPAMVAQLSGQRLGLGMSIFSMTGELARTIGPLIIAGAISWWTLEGTYRLIPLGLLISAFLFWRLRNVDLTLPATKGVGVKTVFRSMLPMLPAMALVLVARAFLLSALVTFLPTFLTVKGVAYGLAAASVSIVEAAGVAGALLGGWASDRWGWRRVLVISFIISPLALFGFLAVQGWATYVLLVIAGFFGILTQPLVMAIVQERFAAQRATANGVYMALAFVIGSLSSVAIGAMGDAWNLQVAFTVSAAIGLLGVPFSVLLTRRPAA